MRHTWGMPIAAAGLLLACGEPQAEQEYPDAVTADPDHYSVEFENDAVRLLRITYGPGEASSIHRHPANCSIALGPSSWRMTDAQGEVTEDDGGEMGVVGCTEGEVHLPENSGAETSELILVEFKDGGTPGAGLDSEHPDALTADPDHYSVEFENDVVRVMRISYGPGDPAVMHHHPANCVVWLVGQEDVIGQVECSDFQEHEPANTSDGPIELMLVEFKGRTSLQR